jgi:hypothetical protein
MTACVWRGMPRGARELDAGARGDGVAKSGKMGSPPRCPNRILPTTIRPARIYHWTRMRRCGGRSSDAEPLSPRPFCPACIISMRGYDFREGQVGATTE